MPICQKNDEKICVELGKSKPRKDRRSKKGVGGCGAEGGGGKNGGKALGL